MMVFTKEDKVVIKFVRETKRYGAKRFLSGVPYKAVVAKWTKTVNKEN